MVPEHKFWGGGQIVLECDSEQSETNFMDHTTQIGSKCDNTLQKHNKQVMEVQTVHRNFQKFICQWKGAQWNFGAPPSTPAGPSVPRK